MEKEIKNLEELKKLTAGYLNTLKPAKEEKNFIVPKSNFKIIKSQAA